MAPRHLADLFKQLLAIKRVHTFLRTEDLEHLSSTASETTLAESSASALLVQGDLTWSRSPAPADSAGVTVFTLRGLDLSFPRGQISLVAGKAGAGKTLLLLALLGEVQLVRGKITYAVSPMLDPDEADEGFRWELQGDAVAYVPQTAWLQSMSIRLVCMVQVGRVADIQRQHTLWSAHEGTQIPMGATCESDWKQYVLTLGLRAAIRPASLGGQ